MRTTPLRQAPKFEAMNPLRRAHEGTLRTHQSLKSGITMTTRLEKALATLTDDQRERFEERAAIAEYDGKLTRRAAEVLAWREVTRKENDGESSK